MDRYVLPFLNYVLDRLSGKPAGLGTGTLNRPYIPMAIQESLEAFQTEHPYSQKIYFIMMQFSQTEAHGGIQQTVKSTLSKPGFTGLLARDKFPMKSEKIQKSFRNRIDEKP
jgi:hypothetical protein